MLKKKEITLKVQYLAELRGTEFDSDWVDEYVEDGYSIVVTAFEDSGAMIDQHITGWYKELDELKLQEEEEGFMVYGGYLNSIELSNKLEELGFKIEVDKDYVMEYSADAKKKLIKRLESDLLEAVDDEKYELAAQIRDEIKKYEVD